MNLEQRLERLQKQVTMALAHVEGKQVPQQQYDNLMQECALLHSIVEGQRKVLLSILESPVLDKKDRQALTEYTLELEVWDQVQSDQEELDVLAAEHELLEKSEDDLQFVEQGEDSEQGGEDFAEGEA